MRLIRLHRSSGAARALLLLIAALSAALLAVAGRPPARAEAHEAMPGAGAGTARAADETFMSMMGEAMRRMDSGMNVAPTGDPDRDFARMMIPHHQGAVDMALVELRFGKDERLRRLAQGIIVEQRQEIALMQSILDERPPAHATSR
jgi:uncharacterized protein (DUF305 family)